eukprot:TRINITY_DN4209_c0_g1_i1.p1 TRINITY_DN4209_c0_g1~~TRINITY_DN4209_c0_g1_i1.p1  ORF type:complete len:203 (-),score=37.52 TRINITY_DN4209_c0_g1_i1:77-685(-)
MFLTNMLSDNFSAWTISITLSLASIIPHFLVILFAPFIQKYGLYYILKRLYQFKFIICIISFLLVKKFNNQFIILLFMLTNKSFSESICKHNNLVVADLVDEDFYIHNRSRPLSTIIFGFHALFTKAGQSLAPIFGWFALTNLDQGQIINQEIKNYIFLLAVCIPFICGIIQSLMWVQFSLKDSYLKLVKFGKQKIKEFEYV